MLLAAGCGAGDSDVGPDCGPNGECPVMYTCGGKGKCIRNSSNAPDARVLAADAAAEPDTSLPDTVPDASPPDAQPPPPDAPPLPEPDASVPDASVTDAPPAAEPDAAAPVT